MKLALQLCCQDGSRYLPYLLASLSRQSFRDWTLFVVDNGSRPEEAAAIRLAVEASDLPSEFHRLETNFGFAGGQDFLWQRHDAEYVQLLNQDAFLEPGYLERVLGHLESHPDCASASGRILRWDFERRDQTEGGRTKTIDSLGLEKRWTGAVRDIGSGQTDDSSAVAKPPLAVFGVSGCLPMYRRAAVLAASHDGALFDADYVSYKEDVDLAYRLEAAGWRAAIVPDAIAYHRRSLGADGRRTASAESKALSYRNHLWTLMTDLPPGLTLIKMPGILPYELAKAAYWLINDPASLLAAGRATIRQWPKLMKKRGFTKKLWTRASPS
jgi:GT2 family glycosyltransferase